MPDIRYFRAATPEHHQAALQFIKTYLTFLGEDLSFQHIDAEYGQLPVMYGPPKGALWLCTVDAAYAGMVALRDKGDGVCEMKRLYVLPQFNGMGIGKQLCLHLLQTAAALGYRSMVLDTLERLAPAYHLYEQLGFVRTEAYYDNPLPGVVYMRKDW